MVRSRESIFNVIKGINRKAIGFSWNGIPYVLVLLEFSSSSKEKIAPITNLLIFILKPVNSNDTSIYQEQGRFGCLAARIDCSAALGYEEFICYCRLCFSSNELCSKAIFQEICCLKYCCVQEGTESKPGLSSWENMFRSNVNKQSRGKSDEGQRISSASCNGRPRGTVQKPLCKTSCVLMGWALAQRPHPGPWIYLNK